MGCRIDGSLCRYMDVIRDDFELIGITRLQWDLLRTDTFVVVFFITRRSK